MTIASLFTFKAADTHFQSQDILFLLFFKCVSAIFVFPCVHIFPLQNCRQFIKVARKERRVILMRSPRIHKKLRLKTSQEPPSTPSQNPPPSNIPTHNLFTQKKSPVRSVSIDSKRTRGRNRVSSTAPPRFVRSTVPSFFLSSSSSVFLPPGFLLSVSPVAVLGLFPTAGGLAGGQGRVLAGVDAAEQRGQFVGDGALDLLK